MWKFMLAFSNLKIDNLLISVTRIVVVCSLTLPLLGESPDSKELSDIGGTKKAARPIRFSVALLGAQSFSCL